MTRCTVCRHPEKKSIDQALLLQEKTLHQLEREFGVGFMALHRHRQNHLHQLVKKGLEARELAEGSVLLQRVERLIDDCRRIARKAEGTKSWSGAAQALREVRQCLELLGKLSGELDAARVRVQVLNQTQVNISASNADDPELEIARLIAQVTNGFSEEALGRYRALAAVPCQTSTE